MRKIIALAFIIVLFNAPLANADTPTDPAVVQISGAEMCSGVYVAPYALLTAAHCVVLPNGQQAGISFNSRHSVSAYVPDCWAKTKLIGCDWAVVRFSGPPALATHPLASGTEPLGASLTLTGYPFTSFNTQKTLSGQFTSILVSAPQEIYYTMPGIQGFSGGAVLNSRNQIIAVHNGYLPPYNGEPASGAGAPVRNEMRNAIAAIPTGYRIAIPQLN
jgi:V8-like Glu-specific endopeptidase